MNYSKEALLLIGRTIVSTEPDKARLIVESKKTPQQKDLGKIPGYFTAYCHKIKSEPQLHIGRIFKREISEANKVFICAMHIVYGGQRSLNKTICGVLNTKQSLISRHIDEVDFRYKKDVDFKKKVDKILKLFI